MQSLTQIFQIILIIVFWGCALLLLIKITKLDIPEQKWFFIGLFCFSLFWGFLELMYYISPSYLVDPSGYETFYKIAYIFGVAAELSILLVIEKTSVKQTRFLFSIITVIGLIFIIILPMEGEAIAGARLASYIFLPAGAASIICLYLYLLIKLTGKLRRETGIILLGIVLIITGYLFDTNIFDSLSTQFSPYWDIMCSLLMIVGGIIVATTYYRRKI